MQWEYIFVAMVGAYEMKFNALGEDRWELIQVIPHAENIPQAVFKRGKRNTEADDQPHMRGKL